MVTRFGKELRKIRIDRGEYLKHMADNVNVSSAYLSSVENGKKKPSENLIKSIVDYYELDNTAINNLTRYIEEDYLKDVSLNIEGASHKKKTFTLSFARRFDSLSDNDIETLTNVLERIRK